MVALATTSASGSSPGESGTLAVLLLAYNRPDHTLRALRAIGDYSPRRLYVACDGPSPEKRLDDEKVTRVREILASPGWSTKLHTRFLPTNLGSARAVEGAIDWFFKTESLGIILEDDCVASDGFFSFAEELLARYADEPRIWGITGSNTARINPPYSYTFVRMPLTWGWATWADRWARHEKGIEKFKTQSSEERKKIWPSESHRAALERHLLSMANWGVPDAWDYPLYWSVAQDRGLWVVPKNHLVSNIGFGADSSNNPPSRFGEIAIAPLEVIEHPPRVDADLRAETSILREVYGLLHPLWINQLVARIRELKGSIGRFSRRRQVMG